MSRVFGDAVQPARRPQRAQQNPLAFLDASGDPQERLSLLETDAETLRDAVALWCSQGYAISFGLTSDGNALGVHLIVGGQKRSKYFTDIASLEDFLKVLAGQTTAP